MTTKIKLGKNFFGNLKYATVILQFVTIELTGIEINDDAAKYLLEKYMVDDEYHTDLAKALLRQDTSKKKQRSKSHASHI